MGKSGTSDELNFQRGIDLRKRANDQLKTRPVSLNSVSWLAQETRPDIRNCVTFGTDGKWRLARGIRCLLERAFQLKKHAAKRLSHPCSAILCRSINILCRSDPAVTVITSQCPIKNWHHIIGEPTIADAICDRLLHHAYKIELKGDSIRKIKK